MVTMIGGDTVGGQGGVGVVVRTATVVSGVGSDVVAAGGVGVVVSGCGSSVVVACSIEVGVAACVVVVEVVSTMSGSVDVGCRVVVGGSGACVVVMGGGRVPTEAAERKGNVWYGKLILPV